MNTFAGARLSNLLTRSGLLVVLFGFLFIFGAVIAVVIKSSLAVSVVFYGAAISLIVFFVEPYIGLLVLLAIIPLQYLGKITEDGSITVAKLLMPVVVGVWIFKALVMRDRRIIEAAFSHPVFLWAMLFILATLPSFINARNLGYAYGFLLLKLMPYFILSVMIANMVTSVSRLTWMYQTVFAISFLVGAFGIVEIVTGESILALFGLEYNLISGADGALVSAKTEVFVEEDAEWFRVASTFLDPDFFGGFIILSAGFAIGLWWLTSSYTVRFFILVYLVMSALNVVGTGSRSVFLASFCFAGFYLISVPFPFRKTLLLSIAAVGVAFIPYIEEFFPQFREGVSLDAYYADPRHGFWTTAVRMIETHPVIGVGLGNFTEAYTVFRTAPALHKPYMAHNILLGVFAETGVVGLTFFCALGAAVFLTLWRTFVTAADEKIQRVTLIMLIAFTCFSLFALTSNTLDFEFAWVVTGVAVALANLGGKKNRRLHPVEDRGTPVRGGTAPSGGSLSG